MMATNRRFFYGWWIVGAGFFILVYIGGFIQFGFTAIFEPIASDFDWSYAQVSLAASVRGLEMSLLSPIVGLLMNRWGPRRLVFAGVAIIGLGLLLLSHTVGNWFHRRVSIAMGILVSGAAAGGLLLPLVTRLIDIFKWRVAMAIFGLGAWGILLPLSLLFRHRPEQYGYLPDGDPSGKPPASEGQSPVQGNGVDSGVKQVLKSSYFWHTVIGFMCHMLVMNAVVTHIMPYLSSIDITRSFSSLMASTIALTSILGRLSFGWLGDIFDKRRVTALSFVLACLGLLSLGYVATAGTWMLVPSLVFVGLGYGGAVPMMPALLREYFGRVRLATVLGLFMGIAALGGMAGPPLVGLAFDKLGSYQVAWFACAGVVIIGIISLLTTPSVGNKMRMTTNGDAGSI
jgi:MFS family permease